MNNFGTINHLNDKQGEGGKPGTINAEEWEIY